MTTAFKRDATWNMVRPGLYVDAAGHGHVFPDEICAELNWPYTPENYLIIVDAVKRLMSPGFVQIVAHEREAS